MVKFITPIVLIIIISLDLFLFVRYLLSRKYHSLILFYTIFCTVFSIVHNMVFDKYTYVQTFGLRDFVFSLIVHLVFNIVFLIYGYITLKRVLPLNVLLLVLNTVSFFLSAFPNSNNTFSEYFMSAASAFYRAVIFAVVNIVITLLIKLVSSIVDSVKKRREAE